MKKIMMPFMICLLVACGSDDEAKDSVEMAKEENNIRDSASTTPDSLVADHNFVVETYSGTLMEIQLGNYAATNATSPAVKQFGKMMVADHSKADSVLTVIARAKGILIPNEPGKDHQQHINGLTGKKGADFDKDYIRLMIEDHETDLEKFSEVAAQSNDEDIKQFAAQNIPVLKKHLDAAKKIRDGLK